MRHDMDRHLETCLQITDQGLVVGYVVEPADPGNRFIVDLIVDGLPVAVLRACTFWSGEPELTIGDQCYAFSWPLPESLLHRACWIEARVANTERLIGHIARTGVVFPSVPSGTPRGMARWNGGLAIRGWVPRPATHLPPRVTAWVEGQLVAETLCREWETVDRGGRLEAMPAFTLRLPEALADGCARSFDVIDGEGRPLPGSPLAVVAFQDCLADIVERDVTLEAERVRARFGDKLLPQSLPFSALLPWLEREQASTPATLAAPAHAVVALVGVESASITRIDLAAMQVTHVELYMLARGGTCTSFRTKELEHLLRDTEPSCDLFVFTLAGSLLQPTAIALFHQALLSHPRSGVAYADVVLNDASGQAWPLAWPAFDRVRWDEQGYAAFCFAIRREGLARAVSFGARSLLDVFEAQLEGIGPEGEPVHIPHLLAHLPALPLQELESDLIESARRKPGTRDVTPKSIPCVLPSIHIRRNISPSRITAVVACRNEGTSLVATLADLQEIRQAADMDIVVVDNASVDPDTSDILSDAARQGCRVVREPGWFRPAHLLNRGAALAESELLLFIAPGVGLRDHAVIEEMNALGQQDDVGAVSPLIVGEGGVVAHAGYILGSGQGLVAPFRDCVAEDVGYAGLLRCAHQRSAVSAACLLTKRIDFKSVGGFDAVHLPLHVYDVDYCLKLRARGRRIIVTPHVYAYGTVPHVAVPDTDLRVPTRDRELARLAQRWELLTTCDPYYSPWLNTDGAPYSGLNWFPQSMAFRQTTQKPERALMEGF